METVVYIQAGDDGFPVDDWAFSAYLGYKMKGSKIVLFKDLAEVPRNKYTLLVACVEYTRQWFEDMEIKIREDITYPTELIGLCKRNIAIMDLDNARFVEPPKFIKPYNKIKAFDSAIIKSDSDWYIYGLDKVNQDIKVLVSEIINIISEWRCYILNGRIIGICNYLGNLQHYPSYWYIQSVIDKFTSQPVAYTIDVAIRDDLYTELIEINDAWSIGNYGLQPVDYCRFLSARWRELLTQNSNK